MNDKDRNLVQEMINEALSKNTTYTDALAPVRFNCPTCNHETLAIREVCSIDRMETNGDGSSRHYIYTQNIRGRKCLVCGNMFMPSPFQPVQYMKDEGKEKLPVINHHASIWPSGKDFIDEGIIKQYMILFAHDHDDANAIRANVYHMLNEQITKFARNHENTPRIPDRAIFAEQTINNYAQRVCNEVGNTEHVVKILNEMLGEQLHRIRMEMK